MPADHGAAKQGGWTEGHKPFVTEGDVTWMRRLCDDGKRSDWGELSPCGVHAVNGEAVLGKTDADGDNACGLSLSHE
jgi:hypothetical protein